ncbi:type I restriction-modification system subunit M [Metamycoplasma neophronis]|uniref:site-specific DNA-methyltransferase (adenine-specific) n=1 Tax=Metamycoplasma neophronis TaxID=872983 RepID=A0ABY2Z4D7_9BACT|nr:type I restriction-modification system subunit M [Metamycoplasma neophronis]TPR53136.1 type I restriction-modification system subunit M [Metamycoplasma neophronis]
MNKQQLANKIWASANNMRSKIEANEYKDYILGFIFYKFLCEREEEYLISEGWSKDEFKDKLVDYNYDPEIYGTEEYEKLSWDIKDSIELIRECQKKIGYFIEYKNLFSTWLKLGNDFDVSNVRDALSAFNRRISKTHTRVFKKIFMTLETGLSKLGDNSNSQTSAIKSLIELIKDIPMDNKQDYDVLGFIYEYLISMFAANAGKKAGEFYTPHEVSVLMSEIVSHHLKDNDTIKIYDPTSGSGSLLINIGKSISKYISNKDAIKYYAQELKDNTYNLTRMNLVMRGILPDNIETRNGDTLKDDWPYFDENDREKTYETIYVDAVVSNPPYSQPWDPENKELDPRFARYGVAPKSKADYAFLLHDLYHLKPNGILTIVLPHGVLFRGNEEEKIRKNLIENNNIDAIIGLPANIFFGTSIPTIIMVLKQKRENTDVLIIDASKNFIKDGKNNRLQTSDIKKIVDTYITRADIEKYSRKVSRDEIRKNEYNLNIPRYVDSNDDTENWDIYATMFGGVPNSEVEKFSQFWKTFPNLKADLFEKANESYLNFKNEEIESSIEKNTDVQKHKKDFATKIAKLNNFLEENLINNVLEANINHLEDKIALKLKDLIRDEALVDFYKAYQILDNNWTTISNDLEVIQTEGLSSARIVKPVMATKSKNNKAYEVREGWSGYLIPFDIVAKERFSDKQEEIDSNIESIENNKNRINEILSELSEEDKESYPDLIAEKEDEFNKKTVEKLAKEFKKIKELSEDSLESKIIEVSNLLTKNKTIEKENKELLNDIQEKIKVVIENLSDEDIKIFLTKKWINPLLNSLSKLPETVLEDFADSLNKLKEKYETTLGSIEEEIKKTEQTLLTLLDELEADENDKKGLEEFKKLLGGF